MNGDLVKYFEEGCLCIITNKIAKKGPADDNALEYYLKNCTCSRHPESANRECWDRANNKLREF